MSTVERQQIEALDAQVEITEGRRSDVLKQMFEGLREGTQQKPNLEA